MRLSVNLILYEICCGQGQALYLRYNIKFNFIITVSYNISANYHGRSKPLPYIVGYNFSLCASTNFFSLFTFHSYLFSAVRLATALPCWILNSHSQATTFSLFFNDMPHSVRRDIFTFGKSDIATSSQ